MEYIKSTYYSWAKSGSLVLGSWSSWLSLDNRASQCNFTLFHIVPLPIIRFILLKILAPLAMIRIARLETSRTTLAQLRGALCNRKWNPCAYIHTYVEWHILHANFLTERNFVWQNKLQIMHYWEENVTSRHFFNLVRINLF